MKIFFLIAVFITSLINMEYTYLHKPDEPNLFEVDSLIFLNENIKPVLDTLIRNEKRCIYYSENLVFGINISKHNTDTTYIIFSCNLSKDVFIDSSLTGFFVYEKKLFFVKDEIESKLFKNLNNKRNFYNNKAKVGHNNQQSKEIPFYEDDRYSIYVYKLAGEKLIFESGYPPCPRE